MATRTTKRTVTFARPFMLGEFSEQFAAGRYFIETDEELLDGMYFPAYVRGTTAMQLVADRRRPGITEPAVIDSFQLDSALALDAVLASMSSPSEVSQLMEPGALLAHSGGSVASLDLIGNKP